MRNKLLFKLTPILFIFFFFINCSSVDDNIPADIKINDFVWKGLNTYYLWQSEITDLADTRFSNQNELNSYLSVFPDPETLFESLLNRPADRFSWIVNDYIALENQFQGITLNNGMEFGLVQYEDDSNNVYGYVRYIIPASDADAKGITRGMIFNDINGLQLTLDNYRDLLFDDTTNYTVGFADFNGGNPTSNGNTTSLTKTELQENPIAVSKVLTVGAKKIGYLMYNQFASSYDGQLNAAFNMFQSENVDDLIVDLRYNGGGSVRTATYLGSMITGQFNGELYSKQVWNEKVQDAIDPSNFVNNFTNQINNGSVNEAINSLNKTRVYFIVSGSSASASELVINSLDPYIEVNLVGTTTVGKQVGSITLYDSDNSQRNGANLNPNHTYAMQPIVLEISNKDNQNKPEGFTPEVFLGENHGDLGVLGERSDPLLDRTLIYISTGARTTTRNKSNIELPEIFNSKLARPTSNNMYVDLK
jgi:carboxyl-terminal processing protease